MMKWFPFNVKKENSGTCLFLFHHAGGSAAVYRKWMAYHSHMEIIPVELPGNGCRSKEEYIYDFNNITEQAATAIYHYANNRKIILYGHSMGAALAFLTCSRLEKRYQKEVKALIVAGRHAANYGYHDVYHTSMGIDRLADELLRIGGTPKEVFEDKDILAFMLQRILRDYKLNEAFQYHGEKVQTSIFAHYGEGDKDATEGMMQGWEQLTFHDCTLKAFPGGHFFPLENSARYFEEIVKIKTLIGA